MEYQSKGKRMTSEELFEKLQTSAVSIAYVDKLGRKQVSLSTLNPESFGPSKTGERSRDNQFNPSRYQPEKSFCVFELNVGWRHIQWKSITHIDGTRVSGIRYVDSN